MQSNTPPHPSEAETVAAKARKLRALMLETGLTFQELANTVQLSEQDLIGLLSGGQPEIRDLTNSESANSAPDDPAEPQTS